MNSTRAAEVIIQALWPGPAPETFDDTVALAASAARAVLLTYASRSAMRSSMLGSALSPPWAVAIAGASASTKNAIATSAPTIPDPNRTFPTPSMTSSSGVSIEMEPAVPPQVTAGSTRTDSIYLIVEGASTPAAIDSELAATGTGASTEPPPPIV